MYDMSTPDAEKQACTPGESENARGARKRPRNLYGQSMGRKGRETRERLINALLALLETRSIRDVSVADIAAAAGTSSSGFYIYFADVSDAALAASESVEQITPEIEKLLGETWDRHNAHDFARILVESYVEFARRHHAILRVRNLAADEGDKRFDEVRDRAIEKIRMLISERIAAAGNALEASAGASAVLALMERIAAISRLPLRRHNSRKNLIAAAAFMVANAMMPPAQQAVVQEERSRHDGDIPDAQKN
jgi:AcrR family transcriptional regulator